MSSRRPLILAVNDQREQLRLLSQVLSLAGYQVVCFEDPLRFLDAIADYERVDLIITDLNMPHVNGWELCNRLRSPEMARYNHIPILVVSATFAGLRATEVRLELGVNDFLPVPYNPEQLRRKVSDILYGHIPKARLHALFVGYEEQDPVVQSFRGFGYETITAADLEGSLSTLGAQTFEVLVYRGQLSLDEARLLFSPDAQMLCSIWVVEHSDPDLGMELARLGVHCVPQDCRGEHLVKICENARQQSCLGKVRELLEKRTLQLLSSEQKYRTLFQSIPDVVFCLSESGTILDVNEAGCTVLGSKAERFLGRCLTDLVPEEGKVQVQLAIHETVLYGYVQYEAVFHCGINEFAAEVHQRRINLEGQTCVLAIARDVSERQQCQQAVLASDTRYRIIAENTYDWEFWLSPQGYFLFSSPSAEKVTGYSSLDFEDDPGLITQLVHPDDLEMFMGHWHMEGADDLPKDFEFRLCHRDGRVRWLSHVSIAVFDPQGNFLGARGSHRDITEKRIYDEERTKLVTALEQISEAILVTDDLGQIHYVNEAFLRRAGQGGCWVGRSIRDLPGDERWLSSQHEILESMGGGRSWNGHYARLTQERARHQEIVCTVNPVRDSKGRIVSFVWVERDVTEERHLAEQLRQSQKLEAIGTLAGGIAHDFNNLLSGILGYSSLLKMQAGSSPEVLHSAEVIERTARRAAELTQKLLGFARRGKNQNVEVSLHRAIDDCIELLSRTIDKRIEIVKDFQCKQAVVMGDPTQMEQILLNLAINARDAVGDRGRISFKTRYESVKGDTSANLDGAMASGDYVVVSVQDDGCGIPLDLQERIFEPFFTTKENGKGTGMGLAMVYGIVKNHGGGVRLESSPARGTTFHIYLPQAKPVPPVQREMPVLPPVKGSGLVFVVDDEELLRDVARRLLQHLGYQVITAEDGVQAQTIYAQRWRDIDLVIVDMIMPKLGGADCFRALKKINPEVRAILSTGYSVNETAQEVLNEGMVGFIQKPYQLHQLSEVVVRALRQSEAVR